MLILTKLQNVYTKIHSCINFKIKNKHNNKFFGKTGKYVFVFT